MFNSPNLNYPSSPGESCRSRTKRIRTSTFSLQQLEQRLLLAKNALLEFVDQDGDVARLKLSGPGSVEGGDADGNGLSEIVLIGTDAATSSLTVSVRKGPAGTGLIPLDAIQGTGLKRLNAKAVDLVGLGIELAGLPTQKTTITAHLVGAGATVRVGSAIGKLSAASFGDSTVVAPRIGSLRVSGDKRLGIAGDFSADITLSGEGIPAGKPVLGSVKIAGTASGIAVNVAGEIGSFSVGRLVSSTIFTGFTPNDAAALLRGGTFVAGSMIKSFEATGIKDSTAAAFASSTIAADIIGRVTLDSVAADNADQSFGIRARSSIKSVRVTASDFQYKAAIPTPQGIDDFQISFGPNSPNISGFAPDSGVAGDGITNATGVTLTGTAEPGAPVTLIFNGTRQGTATAQADGRWTFTGPAQPSGFYNITITAVTQDAFGNTSVPSNALTLTIDTVAPGAPVFDLAPSSDTGALGDRVTGSGHVTLVGQTDPRTTVSLVGTGLSALSSVEGRFQLANVPLEPGTNVFVAEVSDAAGNTATFSGPIERANEIVQQDAVLYWNQELLESVRLDASTPPYASRAMAMVHAAIYDAVSAIDGTPPLYVAVPAPTGAPAEVVVTSAAHHVLSYLYPGQQARLDAARDASFARVPDGPGKVAGATLGVAIGDAIIALRARDGWDDFVAHVSQSGAGAWQPTAPMFDEALLPQWADLESFAMSDPDQFRPSGPPALESTEYAVALADVKALGSAQSLTRSAEQTQIARFWADGPGTYTPPGHWNQIAAQLALDQGNSLSQNSRLFAELNVALADAAIVAWDAKYAFEFWRPITAIREADSDANPVTSGDATWTPLLVTPPFPEYVSGHSTFSGAAATILAASFGDTVGFTTTSLGLPGVQRTFSSFQAAVEEAGRSRIYGGIHFEFANQDGQNAGRELARQVLDTFSVSTDVHPPQVLFDAADSGATATNFTAQGRVLDNLSGTTSLDVQLDSGSFASLAFDAQGRFTLTTTLPLDGSADGPHTLRFRASDAAGNDSPLVELNFTLDTRAPELSLDSPSDAGAVNGDTLLSGVADGTGSAITSVNYRMDGGQIVPVSYDKVTGRFDQPLDLSKLAVGQHVLTLAAQDAAGHQTAASVTLSYTAPIPFTVTATTPLPGAVDVGTTFRPQVFFSRPVDPVSLGANNLFATGPAGTVLPASIVAAGDGSFAWLFFAGPMPGTSRVTVYIDGATIRALADGATLDADGDGVAGGSTQYTFTTVSLTPQPDTTLSGRVIDPGPDLRPMTFDDILAGPDQALHTPDDLFQLPLTGAKVFIVGLEDQALFTDAAGNFRFDSVPAGDVKLAIDGRSVSNAPIGFYFPEMVMDLNIQLAQANTVMGSMGTRDEMAANSDRQEVYLPRLRTSLLQDVSAIEPTLIGVAAESAPNLTADQRSLLTIEIQPGSLIDDQGNPVVGGQVGISTVPSELVRDMLPPGVLQHTFDITVQAPGISNFSTPAPMTFPNVFGAEPGSRLNFLSFDHTTGRLVIEGTATVSADGRSVRTDPGTGITHPGWHGLTPPGANGKPGGCPLPRPRPESGDRVIQHEAVVWPMISGETGSFPALTWRAPPAVPGVSPTPPSRCTFPGRVLDSFLGVRIQVDGPLAQFMKTPDSPTGGLNLTNQEFTLRAGQRGRVILAGDAKSYDQLFASQAGGFQGLEHDQLYGARITVTEVRNQPDGTRTFDVTPYYLYRWVDAIDAEQAIDHKGTTAAFHRTLADPFDPIIRTKKVDLFLPSSSQTTFQGLSTEFQYPGSFGGNAVGQWNFVPSSPGDKTDQVTIRADGIEVGNLISKGKATAPTTIILNLDSFQQVLASLAPQVRDAFNAQELLVEVQQDFNRVNEGGLGRAYYVVANASDVDSRLAGGTVTVNWAQQIADGDVYGRVIPVDPADLYERNTATLRSWLTSPNISRGAKEWGLAESINRNAVNTVEVAVAIHAEATRTTFSKHLANTVGHEVAHTFSIPEGYYRRGNERADQVDLEPYDIMRSGDRRNVDLTFGARNQELLRAAQGAHPNADGTLSHALQFYRGRYYAFCDPFSIQGAPCVAGFRDRLDPTDELPQLVIARANEELATGDSAVFDSTPADDPGGASATLELILSNPGFLPLTIQAVTLANGSQGFSIVNPEIAGTSLDPGAVTTLTLRFDPAASGELEDTLVITSDAGATPSFHLVLQGTAFPQGPTARFVVTKNDNLGGVPVSQGSSGVADLATITNDGAEPLYLSAVRLAEGGGPFTLLGVPADLAANPVTLRRGERFDFGVQFDPDHVGLQRAVIEVATNDPANPELHLSAAGTGLDETVYPGWGNDFVAIETPRLLGSTTLRAVSDDIGNFELFLPAEQFYHQVTFDPQSGLVAHGFGSTPQSGQELDLVTSLIFNASTEPDSDGDGLPDDVEFAVGTASAKADTDGDGLDDFVEIQQGLDPLGGRAFPTGVIAAVALNGEATGIVVEGSTSDPSEQIAYVSTGSYGLAIVDVSRFNKPVVLGQIDLPGENQDVAVDRARNLAIVAGGLAGIHLVDVSNPMQPVRLQTITPAASTVELFDGVAYVTSGESLVSIDLDTHTILQRLDGSGGAGLAREGTTLFTTNGNTLRAFDISGSEIVPRGSLNLPGGGGPLFVGNGIAYVTAPGNFLGGFSTVDATNPDQLNLVSGPATVTNEPTAAIVANGSGISLLAGRVPSPSQTMVPVLDLFSVVDPNNTSAFLTRINLSAEPGGIALASGIAFVADGSAGLQVVNYLSFDTQGQPPSVRISTPVTDIDPATPGIQVSEGATIRVRADVQDDVQARNIELLVNGRVTQNDVSFPFDDLAAVVPDLAPGNETITLQVRATDTGGNTTVSNSIVLRIASDTTAPTIVSLDPPNGTIRNVGLERVRILFSESVAEETVSGNPFQLVDGAGQVVPLLNLQLRQDARLVQLHFEPLAAGDYQLHISAPAISDRSGNPLGTGQILSTFTVRSGPMVEPRVGLFPDRVYNTGDSVRHIAVADLNGDDRADLVSANEDDDTVSVLLGNPDGTLGSRTDYAVSAPQAIAIGDVNGDGRVDLVVASGNGGISIMSGRGDGTFAPRTDYADDLPSTVAVILGDLNGDGRLDVVIGNDAPSVSVLLAREDGSFAPRVDYLVASDHDTPQAVALGDIDGDTDLDILSAGGSTTISVLKGLGDGSFVAGENIDTSPMRIALVALSDLNGDSLVDLIAAEQSDDMIRVQLGRSDGTLGDPATFVANAEIESFALSDLDGDSRPELVIGNERNNSVSAQRGVGDGTFGERINYVVVDDSGAVALGDINGDGRLDLVSAGDEDRISLMLGRGDGTFAADISSYGVPGEVVAVAVADLDRDGHLDVIAVNGGHSAVSVLTGGGVGTLADRTEYAVGAGPRDVIVADLNADSRPDIVTANGGEDSVSVVVGNPDGSFAPRAKYSVGRGPGVLAVGDLNGDGNVDLVTSNRDGNNLSVLLGLGDGTLAPRTDYEVGSQPGSIRLADVNGDGSLDIAFVLVCSGCSSAGVFLNNGDGTFGTPPHYVTVGSSPRFMDIGDINTDGHPDLVVTHFVFGSDHTVSVLLGNGDGTFAPKTEFDVGTLSYLVSVIDLDGDGDLDLAVHYSRTLRVFPGDGSGNFARPAHSTSLSANSMTFADVNGDGRLDVVYGVSGDYGVATLLGKGDGTFGQLPRRDDVNYSGIPLGAALADLNGDGRLDLIATSARTPTGVSVLLGDAAGTFGAQTDYTTDFRPEALALGDLNDDGVTDAVTANSVGSLSVLLSRGNGTFSSALSHSIPNGPNSVALGDLNEDGHLDAVTAHRSGDNITVTLGNGDGTFGANTAYASGRGISSIALGDLNGDGRLDVALANSVANSVSVLLGHGDGTFGPKTDMSAGRFPQFVTTLDLNGDGRLDLAVANEFGNSITILLGSGEDTFAPPVDYMVGTHPVSIAAADLNGDSHLDLVTANIEGSSFSVLFGNGDGTLARSMEFAVNHGPLAVVLADLNEDGRVDVLTANGFADTFSVRFNSDMSSASGLHTAVRSREAAATERALTHQAIELIAREATRRWTSLLGDDRTAHALGDVQYVIADLPGSYLAWATAGVVTIDIDAAGYGWFIDLTPADDGEFSRHNAARDLHAPADSPAAKAFDLLTVLEHELGHLLGLAHGDFGTLMSEALEPGVRRLPDLDSLDWLLDSMI